MMQKVRIDNKCGVNEDLFFPTVEFVKTLKIQPARRVKPSTHPTELSPFQEFLKTELLSTKDSATYKCPNKGCKTFSHFHPSFIERNLAGCYHCDTIETIVKRILQAKGYKFVKLFHNDNKILYVRFICNKGHEHEMTYDDFKKGKNCVKCNKGPLKKKVPDKLKPKSCECKIIGKGGKEIKNAICPHYNFAFYFPEEVEEWDFNLNNILPNQIAPGTREKYWFRCIHCDELYNQMSYSRRCNKRCPYCFAGKISKKNNLAALHPKIAQEYDHDNNMKSCNEILPKSDEKAWWICKDVPGEVHRYLQKIITRTDKTIQGGCYCKMKNYKQLVGGHDYFVTVAYSYPNKYVNGSIKLGIFCPVISKHDNTIHGEFLQEPRNHKNGAGCNKCNRENADSKGVVQIKTILNSLGYVHEKDYFTEHTFEDMKHVKRLKLDFYLQIGDVRIAIEYDGQGHFSAVEIWGGQECLDGVRTRDIIKDVYCLKNKISMLRFPYNAEITQEYIKDIIDLCKSSHVYLSYTHLINPVREQVDLNNIVVLENNTFE
jgi:hypothetical protein